MVNDSYTEVTNRSWFSRIGSAFKGILVGLLLIIGAIGLLFWNEGRAVERYKTLKEGGGKVVSVDLSRVDEANQDKLVHVSGRAETQDVVRDVEFNVEAQVISLHRLVEMYQWQESTRSETRKKLGGGEETVTTYSYDKGWSSHVINSDYFKKVQGHVNPSIMLYSSRTFSAKEVNVGPFQLSPSLISKIDNTEPLAFNYKVPTDSKNSQPVHTQPGGFYIGNNPSQTQVGDLRITFTVVQPTDVSIVSTQSGSTFKPYQAKAGGSIELLQLGVHSAESMFASAQRSNTLLTWVLRVVGFVVMAIAFAMVLAPLVVLADVVPAIGSLLGVGTKLISGMLAGVVSFITIGIAWFVYRPLLGSIFLVVAGALLFFSFKKVKKAEPVSPPPIPKSEPPPVPGR